MQRPGSSGWREWQRDGRRAPAGLWSRLVNGKHDGFKIEDSKEREVFVRYWPKSRTLQIDTAFPRFVINPFKISTISRLKDLGDSIMTAIVLAFTLAIAASILPQFVWPACLK